MKYLITNMTKKQSELIESSGYRNILSSIIVSFMYASYDKVGMIVVIAVMAVTAIGCFVRDRLELV